MAAQQTFTICSQCCVHVVHRPDSLHTTCPFCDGVVEHRTVTRSLSTTLTGMGAKLAAAFGVTMTLTGGLACQKNSPAMDIYGGPPIEEPLESPVGSADMGGLRDASSPDFGAVDSGELGRVPISPAAPIYGGPPVDDELKVIEPIPEGDEP